ncbi:CZB domain-containing protein [Geomonas sp. Red69]|uniref:CZB domain-containing protein n=1 Tax=Geomonas diazotrophica TaxID=2843197 RepID=A0ABX8JFS6_9BACT|nr:MULTISPECIES: CZB domain-containing protein [Geomonas]MBU5638553.1 CZB domain-containing protein [Geomonas diazotrophica]QWV97173.1 CZB domain-containing protein [Geomonas nitrogeniifigens]
MEKQEINNAITEHAMYKFKLNDLISKGQLEDHKGPCTETDCQFGKWFYDTSFSSRHSSSSFYKQVKQLHGEFHQVACKVAGLAVEGKTEEARRLMEYDGEFQQASNKLMETLMRWRDMV